MLGYLKKVAKLESCKGDTSIQTSPTGLDHHSHSSASPSSTISASASASAQPTTPTTTCPTIASALWRPLWPPGKQEAQNGFSINESKQLNDELWFNSCSGWHPRGASARSYNTSIYLPLIKMSQSVDRDDNNESNGEGGANRQFDKEEFERIEDWLDEHPSFVQDYFIRKASRSLVDSWMLAHAVPVSAGK